MKRNIKTQQGSLCLFFVSKVLPVIKDSFKTVITIFIIIFTLSFGTSCKQRMNIKEFIERELARDRSNTIVLYDTSATGYNDIVYVPSEKDIIGTVNIKNEYNVGYTAVLTLDDPSQVSCFDKAPEISVTEAGKFQFTFTFKKEADAGGTEDNTAGKGAMVPVTVKLVKKEGGALFAEKRFTIRCNTPPARLQVSSSGDSFTLERDADPIHHDISLVTCTLAINGKTFNKSFFSSDFASGKTSFIVKKLLKTPPNNVLLYNASGKRTLTGFVTDTVGLQSEEFSCEGDYTYSNKTNFSLSVKDEASSYTPVSFSASGTPNTDTAEKTDYPYKLSDTTCTVKITDLATGAVCQWNGPSGHEKKNKNEECTLQPISDGTMNSITTEFTVIAEDESNTKTYKLTVGRQDGFKVTVDHSGTSSSCDIKVNKFNNGINSMVAISGAVAFVHASDLNDGMLKVQIASKNGANLVKSIQAKIDQSDASDPPATASFYGTNTSGATKDIYGYSFELPMVQSQTLTIGYDNTISFDANGEATIQGEPPITIQVDNSSGKITMLPCDPQATYPANGIIDFSRHPVLDMISNFAANEDFSPNAKQMFPSKTFNYNTNDAIIKVILPKNIAQIKGFTFYSAANLKEIIFPDGFEGDISNNLAFFNCTALEKVQINKSNRYFNDAYGNLIEKEQQGSSYTYENCTVRLAVKNNPKLNGLQARLADGTTIQLQQTSGSDPFFAVYLANGSHNGSAYKITEIKNQACMAMFKYGVIDLPDLKKIWVNNFSGNKITALFITARTPANIDNNNFAIPKDMKNTGHVYVQNSSELEIYKDKWAKDNQNDKSRLYTANNFTISGY